MKKYLFNLMLISTLLLLLLVVMGLVRKTLIQHHSWKLPERVHILFMGASHVENGIDDSMMKTAINWAGSSERYMYTYIKLKHLLPVNPQVDTIFLELSPTDLWEDADYKYHVLNEQSRYVPLYWPFYELEHWKVVLDEPVQSMTLVLESLLQKKDFNHSKWWKKMGGFNKVDSIMDLSQVRPNLLSSRDYAQGYGNEVNYHYLRQIIMLCKQNRIQLFFIETPTYHPEYYYNQDYYYQSYHNNFAEIELFDYSKWPVANDERADAHHLNFKGAKRFTRELINRFHIE